MPLSRQSRKFPHYLYEQVQAACCFQESALEVVHALHLHVRKTVCAQTWQTIGTTWLVLTSCFSTNSGTATGS